MVAPGNVAALVGILADERDCDRALDRLVIACMDLTRSRNSLIARMNDELGTLELRHGAGEDWTLTVLNEMIQVGVAGQGIVSDVAATKESFMTGDVRSEPKYRTLFETSRSEIAVPVLDRHGRVRAVINVEADRLNNYTESDLRLCETVANLAALAIERDETNRREEALVQISQALGKALTEEDLVDKVLVVANDVLRFQACSIFLWDQSVGQFMLRGSIGVLKDEVGKVGYKPGEGCTGFVCESGESVLLNEPQKHPNWLALHVELPGAQIASFLAVPVVFRGQSIGCIRVLRRESDNIFLDIRFSEDDQVILETIAEQVAAGLENIRSVQRIIRVERMVAWGELSAKSSHMIGNRVFALKGDVNEFGHLLQDPNLRKEDLEEIQKSLWVNVTRIEEILQDFRDFVSATQLSTARADINFIVEESVREVFPRRSAVALEFDLDKGLPEVNVDSRKLRRAISEIVENSLSFFDKGRLQVCTRIAKKDEVKKGRLPSKNTYVAIEIVDQGPGVDSEMKQRIFEPFYSSRVKGMGLGLSIVKGIVDAHGGTVYEDGKPGGGARFMVLLPAADRP